MKRKNQLVIIGAGGHGRVAADIAGGIGYEKILFLDDGPMPGVTGKTEAYRKYLESADFFVAIGSSAVREKFHRMLAASGVTPVCLIHPKAVVARDVVLGAGTAVMAGAVVNPGAVLGEGVIVNTCASVDHDCRIGDFVHVAVGAHVCGTVAVGDHTWIGAGATVINNIRICGNCMIGAGAAVVKDIVLPGTYVGVPARRMK